MKENNMPKADFVTAIVLLVFSLTITILSIRMPRMEEVGANPYSAPGIVPGFLGVIIFVLSIILLVRSLLKNGYKFDLSQKTVIAFFKDDSILRVLLTIIISVIYGAGLLGRIPYVLATFLYVMVFVLIFEYPFHRKASKQETAFLIFFIQTIVIAGVAAVAFRYLFIVISVNLLENIPNPYMVATLLYFIAFVAIFEYYSAKKCIGKKKSDVFFFIQAILISIVVAAISGYIFKFIGIDYGNNNSLFEIASYIAVVTLIYVSIFIILFEYRFERKFSSQEKAILFSFAQAILVSSIVAAVFRYLFLVKLP